MPTIRMPNGAILEVTLEEWPQVAPTLGLGVTVMELRPYETSAIEWIVDYAVEHPRGRLLLVAPPGAGKTVVGASVARLMAYDNNLPSLVVAHRRELVNQHVAQLVLAGVRRDDIGVIMGADRRERAEASIQVASIDTINRRDKPLACLVITDEAHRDASDSRRKLRALYPDAFHLGMTATPIRLGRRRSLQYDFDELYVATTPTELIDGGWLAAPRIFSLPEDRLPDTSDIEIVQGDYRPSATGALLDTKERVALLVDDWGARARDLRTVVFATTIEHSKHVAQAFKGAGVRAAHLDESTPRGERDRILAAVETGAISVVTCVNILSEGWDCPPCKCAILSRPTKSLNVHIQQCGRALRPWQSVKPLILDHVGNMLAHGPPHADREWSLVLSERNGRRRGSSSSGSSGSAVRICTACSGVSPFESPACIECGGAFPALLSAPPPPFVPYVLQPYRLREDEEATELARIAAFAKKRAFSPEWVTLVFKTKYGYAPVDPGAVKRVWNAVG